MTTQNAELVRKVREEILRNASNLRPDELALTVESVIEMHLSASAPKAGEDKDVEITWRNLALQFDAHRIQACSMIKYAVASIEEYRTVRDILREPLATLKTFLNTPPLSGEAVLAERVAALATSAPKPQHEVTAERKETFDEWWDRDQAGGGFDKTTQNVACAAWHQARRLYASPLVMEEAVKAETRVSHEMALAGFYKAQEQSVKDKPLYDQCVAIYLAMANATSAPKPQHEVTAELDDENDPLSQEKWAALLAGRDEFIGSRGLWQDFVDTLPQPGRVKPPVVEEAVRAEREANIAALLAVPDNIPCVVRVPDQEDLTSGGTPFIEPAHDRHTTRRATRQDYVAAVRNRFVLSPGDAS